jgi:hypothetical protein
MASEGLVRVNKHQFLAAGWLASLWAEDVSLELEMHGNAVKLAPVQALTSTA